ncbi:MAG: CDGSH iron-sulfur domain-containing protein [Anaerolineales bacterium]|nr:CDGSH iron-sulfur domain-containing protein [Chloroflexota bacterium]MBL6982700.1 CDGSH iron-sulfur domain-containing protein [Anaerolineales bacterium]
MSEKVEIKVLENGPLLISGTATVTDAEGNVSETQGSMVALCRCGQSANKPFCDGTHKNAGFEASEAVISVQ